MHQQTLKEPAATGFTWKHRHAWHTYGKKNTAMMHDYNYGDGNATKDQNSKAN